MEGSVASMSGCLVVVADVTGSDVVLDIRVHMWLDDIPLDEFHYRVQAHVSWYIRIMDGFPDIVSEVSIAAFQDSKASLEVDRATLVEDILGRDALHSSDRFLLPPCVSSCCDDYAF